MVSNFVGHGRHGRDTIGWLLERAKVKIATQCLGGPVEFVMASLPTHVSISPPMHGLAQTGLCADAMK